MFCDVCGDEIHPLAYTHLGENGRPIHEECHVDYSEED